jgi:hypothetical protein
MEDHHGEKVGHAIEVKEVHKPALFGLFADFLFHPLQSSLTLEEVVELGEVGGFELEEPSFTIRVKVGKGGIIGNLGVDLRDRAA